MVVIFVMIFSPSKVSVIVPSSLKTVVSFSPNSLVSVMLPSSLKEKSLNQLLNNKENRSFRKQVTSGNFPASCFYCSNTGGRYTTKNGFTDL